MTKIIDLIKESFELWVKRRWLKTIEKEVDKCNKLSAELRKQRYVVNGLVKKYNQIYSPDEAKGGIEE